MCTTTNHALLFQKQHVRYVSEYQQYLDATVKEEVEFDNDFGVYDMGL